MTLVRHLASGQKRIPEPLMKLKAPGFITPTPGVSSEIKAQIEVNAPIARAGAATAAAAEAAKTAGES